MSNKVSFFVFFVVLFFITTHAQSSTSWLAEVSDEVEIPIDVFGESQKLIIWLPSKKGIRSEVRIIQEQLPLLGYEVWAADLHEAYYAPLGREGISYFKPNDISELIKLALTKGKTSVSIFTTGRTVPVAMKALRVAQKQFLNDKRITGLMMLHPYLYSQRPTMGKDAIYSPITYSFNLPLHLFSPEYSTKFARVDELKKKLETGGANVYVEKLMGVGGGFHARHSDELSDLSVSYKISMPMMMHKAIKKMQKLPSPSEIMSMTKSAEDLSFKASLPNLQPYTGNQNLKNINLLNTLGTKTNLEKYRGKTVLVNFWASWCGPCVKEIPSLVRLKKSLSNYPFEILAVNIGEDIDAIKKFMKPFNVNFPVLLDPNSTLVKPWKLYAYPSNFLIDEKGVVKYAYYGALEWDSPEIVQTLQNELDKTH